jgi:GH25 family lysozyme M1 (1,4-beta-N-acetylmuramidase)
MTVNRPLVIDIYPGDEVVDAAKVKAFGIVGVIHAASESTDVVDRLYAARRKAFTDLGLKMGRLSFRPRRRSGRRG